MLACLSENDLDWEECLTSAYLGTVSWPSSTYSLSQVILRGQLQDESEADGEAVIGTLDVHAVKAMKGEVLIGNSKHAAYLANVCVSDEAKRQGVGADMIQSARQISKDWGELPSC